MSNNNNWREKDLTSGVEDLSNIFHGVKIGFMICHPILAIKMIAKNVKWRRQRVKYGFCDYDVYDFDLYLTSLIPNMLNNLYEHTNGWNPFDFDTFEDWQNALKNVIMEFDKTNSGHSVNYNKYADLCDSEHFKNADHNALYAEESAKIMNRIDKNRAEAFSSLNKIFKNLYW